MMTDFLLWYLCLTVVGVLAMPLTFRLLPFLKDRGYAFSRIIGLLIWGYSFWIFASFGLIPNNTAGALTALFVLIVLSSFCLKNDGLSVLKENLSINKKSIITSEILFFSAFLLLAILRAAVPEISGTEKPMELAFINAILKSPQFPPHDPWLSGYAISYYYFGYVMVSLLIRLTGVTSGVGFNLAVASWFALTAIASYGVLFNLIQKFIEDKKLGTLVKSTRTHLWALLAPFLILIASNYESFLEILHARGIFWQQAADGSWISKFWTWLNILELNEPPAQPFSWIPNRPGGIVWWRASRVIHDFNLAGVGQEVIDEFPFFSYLLGDLHPHVLSMPFVILAVACSLNLWLASYETDLHQLKIVNWLKRYDFWFMALLFGGLAFLNTWDFPIFVALASATFVIGKAYHVGWNFWKIGEFLIGGLILGISGVILYLPFYVGFSSQAGGILPSLSFYTRWVHFWIMFGVLLIPICGYLIYLWKHFGNRAAFSKGAKLGGAVLGGLWIFSYLMSGVILWVADLAKKGLVSGSQQLNSWSSLFYTIHGSDSTSDLLGETNLNRLLQPGTWLTLLAIMILVFALISVLTKKPKDDEKNTMLEPQENSTMVHTFVLLLILVGVGLTLVPEFIYLRDQFGTRMNTIFKFYFQSWILWGIAAGFAFYVIWNYLSGKVKHLSKVVLVISVILSLAYPVLMTLQRTNYFHPSEWTLDGTKNFQIYGGSDEWAGITWLTNAPYGNIVEAVGGSYTQYARIATFSGYPSVLGWPGHESQWRGGGTEMGSRQSDIETLYRTTGWEEAKTILEKYAIRYIIVGNIERSTYRVDERKFESNLTKAFTQNQFTIYEYSGENHP